MLLKSALVILAAGSMVGCSASISPMGSAGSDQPEAQLAAYAASTKYPDAKASDDMKLSAMVNRDKKTIQIINYTDQTLTNVNVWINQTYLYRVNSIPANGLQTLSTNDFYDGTGRSLGAQASPITKVQVQTGDNIYNAMGPIFQ